MSKMEITTQDLLLRLGSTSHLRSARAEALFRRLRFDKQDQISDALMRAPRRMDATEIDEKLLNKPRAPRRSGKR